MCGISGFIHHQLSESRAREVVEKMNSLLRHRGPDNQASWTGEGLCLGHTRLSIIDLSSQSNQPLKSEDGRYVIVYNGELYNYRELKLELQRSPVGSGVKPWFFRTASDTEVVLAAFERWGINCLHHFSGMFAFAVYDSSEKKLWLARDKMGVKPLYYSSGEEGFIFSSEIRAIIHAGLKHFSLNRETLAEYLMYQTVHAPGTIVSGIQMLMPGHYIEYSAGSMAITQYYDLNKTKTTAAHMPYAEICSKTFELLSLAVEKRMQADVPFGAFLSGGIDSSAVVALMSKVSTEPVRTFNVAFDEGEFSESKYARVIAAKYRTQHEEIKLRPSDFLSQLPQALASLDHPSGDGPNTYIVSKATRQAGITMALSGIGGDELFAGYDVFKRMHDLQAKSWINAVPQVLRKAAGSFAGRKNTVAAKKMAELLSEKKITFTEAYKYSRTVFTKKELWSMMPAADPFAQIKKLTEAVPQNQNYLLTAVSLSEIQTYLQNVLLRDTDQMSMAVALEVREPFLDHQLVEFVLSVPDEYKFPHTPKKLLTDTLGDLLPAEVVNRPKMGFTLPWQHWLKNDLRTFCESQIHGFESKNLCLENSASRLWQRFLKGDPLVTWSRIWHIIVLNHWLDQNKIMIS